MKKIALAIVATASIAAIPSLTFNVNALEHPDHEQPARGDGPAADGVGQGRNNPNGSNGTIKIDGYQWNGHPNNEPHIGNCTFEVDFYGFDEGDSAELTFYQWPGTGDKSLIQSSGAIDIGGDGAGGGIDIDQQYFVLLGGDLGNLHPKHGYHIRGEATITSGERTYTKTKVFWLSGDCNSET
jgi:hypothetical protein